VQVLVLLASGLSMQESALKLRIAHVTIRAHIHEAMKRTKARTRDQLMAMAGASGLYHQDQSTVSMNTATQDR
jgi:DNA-binding CsgD family transcriptional regulator